MVTGGMHEGTSDTQVPQTPPLEKYVDPLPRPMTAIPDRSVYPGADYYEITMRQGSWRFHRDLKAATVWGYWATNPHDPDKPIGMGYLGPTIIVTKDHPTVVKYRNELPTTHLFQFVIDAFARGTPHRETPPPYKPPPFPPNVNVWNVVHQHGGFTAPQSDGFRCSRSASDGVHARVYTTLDPSRVKRNEAIYGYTNHERASMLWYHDHGMGMTSLNVYAGLAGPYLVRDPADERLGLPRGEFEVPLILQDRTFHSGRLARLHHDAEGRRGHPGRQREGVPFPGRRAATLSAAHSQRFERAFLAAEVRRSQGRTASAHTAVLADRHRRRLPSPLHMLNFLIGSAERYDLIVDFSRVPMGTNVTLDELQRAGPLPRARHRTGNLGNHAVPGHRTIVRSADQTTPPKKLALPAVASDRAETAHPSAGMGRVPAQALRHHDVQRGALHGAVRRTSSRWARPRSGSTSIPTTTPTRCMSTSSTSRC